MTDDQFFSQQQSQKEITSQPQRTLSPEENPFATNSDDLAPLVTEIEPHKPGPGIWESLLWLTAFIVLQVVLGVFFVGGAMIWAATQGIGPKQFNFSQLSPTLQLLLVGGPSLAGYFILIPAGLWRLSPHPFKQLDLSLPTFSQTLISVSLMIPLTIIADSLFRVTEQVWNALLEMIPALTFLNDTDIHEVLAGFDGVSFPLMLFFIAIVPAVGEEFIFRGLLGRGLVSRWGVITGVIITSVFFAAVHLYPPHVIAILPVGIGIHIVYLTTKSFWTPVLFHFLNNALAALMLRAVAEEQTSSAWLVMGAIAYSVWCVFWLIKSRTRYIRAENEPSLARSQKRSSQTYLVPTLIAALVIGVELALIASDFGNI